MLITVEDDSLTGLWFENQKYFPADLSHALWQETPVHRQVISWLECYFAGKNPDAHTIPMKPEGTAFQKAVWRELQKIPYGSTVTYGAIASTIARQKGLARMSAQAIGGAVGHNPISVLIPCHRVLGADGSLTGYAGGTEKKEYLLRLERSR